MKSVLLLDVVPRINVTIARSLSKHGIPVHVVAFSETQQKLRAKGIKAFWRLSVEANSADKFVDELSILIKKIDADILIPCSDNAIKIVIDYHSKLNNLITIASPPPEISINAIDKDKTMQIAKSCGVPIPNTHYITNASELEAICDRLIYPVVVKPQNKTGNISFRVEYCKSYSDLESLISRNQNSTIYLVQEYCNGVGVGVEILMHKNEPLSVFQHRRLKEYPVSGGVSVLAIAEEVDSELREYSVRLLKALQWEGIAMVEFRVDPRQGPKLMEVNGRYWGSCSLSLFAGLELPYYHWQILHDIDPKVPSSYKTGIKIRWTMGLTQRLLNVMYSKENNTKKFKELIDFFVCIVSGTKDILCNLHDLRLGIFEIFLIFRYVFGGLMSKALAVIFGKQRLRRWRDFFALPQESRFLTLKTRFDHFLEICSFRQKKIPSKVRKIVFVCYGNIIRSPMAAALLQKKISNSKSTIQVISAGLSAKEGAKADTRAQKISTEFGIDLSSHNAMQLSREMIAEADIVFVMDYFNKAEFLLKFPEYKNKVYFLSSIGNSFWQKRVIADPYYGTESNIRFSYKRIGFYIEQLFKNICQAPRDVFKNEN